MPAVAKKRQPKSEIICVRLKRYNKRKGYLIRQFGLFGYIFKEEQNWYKVPSRIVYLNKEIDLKDYLSNVRQDNEDPDSPDAFDIVTEKEMLAINKRERLIEQQKQYDLRRVGDPVDMTAGRGRRASKREDDERGDLTLNDVRYKPAGRRKSPRVIRGVDVEE